MHAEGHRVLVARRQDHLPALVVANAQLVAIATGGRADRRADLEVLVGHPRGAPTPRELGVLKDALAAGAHDVDQVHVVVHGIFLVDADEHLGRPARGELDQLDLDVVERREVGRRTGLEVRAEQPPVLVATGILEVQEVSPVVRPLVEADPSVNVGGDGNRAAGVRHLPRR